MSADNGIYIGVFPRVVDEALTVDKNDKEYRVIHAQAIDNCDYGNKEMQDAFRFQYFVGMNPVFSREEAWKIAQDLYKKMEEEDSDFGFVLEYGVSEIHFDRPFPYDMTAEEAAKITE